MKYVLDSNVALKWVIAEADSGRAVRLRDEYRTGINDLIAPDLFTPEVANALVAAERQGRIRPGEAAHFLLDIQLNAPMYLPSSPLLLRGMEIALATRHAVYDCVYVALAERERCELVTADGQLVRSLQAHFPFIISLAALP